MRLLLGTNNKEETRRTQCCDRLKHLWIFHVRRPRTSRTALSEEEQRGLHGLHGHCAQSFDSNVWNFDHETCSLIVSQPIKQMMIPSDLGRPFEPYHTLLPNCFHGP